MLEVTLTVRTRHETQRVSVTRSRLTLGRGDDALLRIEDPSLSRVHASINSDGRKVWILDEGSINGSFVNGEVVPAAGRPLVDGDEITIGDDTSIMIGISGSGAAAAVTKRRPLVAGTMVSVPLAVVGLLLAALIGSRLFSGLGGDLGQPVDAKGAGTNAVRNASQPAEKDAGMGSTGAPQAPSVLVDPQPSSGARPPSNSSPDQVQPARRRLYREMTDQQRTDFIDTESQKITMSMSNSTRPEVFDQFVLTQIKRWVDSYSAGRKTSGLWGVEAGIIFKRAAEYAPYISRCFSQQDVPPIIGLYIVWIETAYVNIAYENKAHAMGLFQFIPGTARQYGVDPAQRTNVEKMAPAAALYMKHRIAYFGGDAKGVALSIANYNRGGTPADLRKTIDKENPERSFWTLMANKEKLNHYFQNENVDYVPRFFAAAIVGENPRIFGVDANPISSYR